MSIQVSTHGMRTAEQQQAISAHEIAHINTPGKNVDLSREQVRQVQSVGAVEANAAALRAQDDTLGSLLDLKG